MGRQRWSRCAAAGASAPARSSSASERGGQPRPPHTAVRRGLIVALVAACALGAPSCGRDPAAGAGGPGAATVVRVVDGDTVVVDLAGRETSVRLVGIDTPETVDPRRPVGCYGPEASAHTKQLLPRGTAVRLERDAELHDRYGRLLAYVRRASDGLFVNEDLLAGGYAKVLSIAPNTTYAPRFAAVERGARTTGQGLWSACPHQ